MRTTRAAAKRAGGEWPDENGPNKRPALSNISNGAAQAQAASTSNTLASSSNAGAQSSSKGKGRRQKGRRGSAAKARASSRRCEAPQSSSSDQTVAETESQPLLRPETSAQEQTNAKRVDSLASSDTRDAVLEAGRGGWTSSLGYSCIDNNPGDPQACAIYATDIYQHLKRAELRGRPITDFIEVVQKDITANMRGILVDWIVEVAEEYRLVPDTLYLTCSFIDRFLSRFVVNRSRLQLLGVSCMLIASKYEEIYAPQVDEFCYITDNTYKREEVIDMEKQILNGLHFELSIPTTKSFLRRFIRAAQVSFEVPSLQLEFLGNYLAELTLMEYSFLRFLPSLVAASAVFLSKLTMDSTKHPWTPTLQHYTGYCPQQLKVCVLALHDIQWQKGGTLPAIREKYSQSKFQSVSMLVPPSGIEPRFFEDVVSEIVP